LPTVKQTFEFELLYIVYPKQKHVDCSHLCVVL